MALGMHVIRLFKDGHFRDITIDDRIPCDRNARPVFAKPLRNEFYPCLIEKAMAKLCGSYLPVTTYGTSTCLTDLFGGFPFTRVVAPNHAQNEWLFKLLSNANTDTRTMLISASIDRDRVSRLHDLSPGQAYAVLGTRSGHKGKKTVRVKGVHAGEWAKEEIDAERKKQTMIRNAFDVPYDVFCSAFSHLDYVRLPTHPVVELNSHPVPLASSIIELIPAHTGVLYLCLSQPDPLLKRNHGTLSPEQKEREREREREVARVRTEKARQDFERDRARERDGLIDLTGIRLSVHNVPTRQGYTTTTSN
ncbi:hypothetical protein KIPB_010068, partial [Kipferlia bialata]|eukprot:g10068.t1